MKLYSLDEFIDEEIGATGTPDRMAFDQRVQEKLSAQEKSSSCHVVMPVSLHNSVKARASQLGKTMSDYISSLVIRDLGLA